MKQEPGAASANKQPFRFGVSVRHAASRAEWRRKVHRIASLGFDILVVSDHLDGQLGAVPAIASAAEAEPEMRIGSLVFAVGFRHPALLAIEVATLDVLTDGRFEVGVGAGWLRADFEASGIPFHLPRVRAERLEETVAILLACREKGPATFVGSHYRVRALRTPRAVQRPGVPLLVAAGGRRTLAMAATRADIVSVMVAGHRAGGLDWQDLRAGRVAEKVALLREAAGPRFRSLELNVLLQRVRLTRQRRAVARRLATEFALDPTEVLSSPYFAVGTVSQVADELRRVRAELGVSYLTVREEDMESFALVLAELRGTGERPPTG